MRLSQHLTAPAQHRHASTMLLLLLLLEWVTLITDTYHQLTTCLHSAPNVTTYMYIASSSNKDLCFM